MDEEVIDCISFLSNMRPTLDRPASSELRLLEKVVVIDLFDPDQIGASKIYMNSLIRSALEEPANDAHATRPRVIVLDGRYLFNEYEFVHRFVDEKEKLEQVQIFRPIDDHSLLMTIEVNVKLNLALNLNCHLIVIIPHSKIIFPDLLRAINRKLFPKDIHLNVLFLVESLSQKKFEVFKDTKHMEVIRCQFELPECQEDTTLRKDGPISTSEEQKLSVTSSKNNTQISKVIRFRS